MRRNILHPKAKTLLSLARRARKIEFGNDACLRAVENGSARLLVVSEDIGAGTLRKFEQIAAEKVQLVRSGTKAEFGELFNRRPVAVLAITDSSFAEGIAGYLVK